MRHLTAANQIRGMLEGSEHHKANKRENRGTDCGRVGYNFKLFERKRLSLEVKFEPTT